MRVRPKFNRTDSLIETRKQTQRRMPCDDEGETSDMSTSKGMSRIVGNQQNQEETRGDSPLEPSEGAWLCWIP